MKATKLEEENSDLRQALADQIENQMRMKIPIHFPQKLKKEEKRVKGTEAEDFLNSQPFDWILFNGGIDEIEATPMGLHKIRERFMRLAASSNIESRELSLYVGALKTAMESLEGNKDPPFYETFLFFFF